MKHPASQKRTRITTDITASSIIYFNAYRISTAALNSPFSSTRKGRHLCFHIPRPILDNRSTLRLFELNSVVLHTIHHPSPPTLLRSRDPSFFVQQLHLLAALRANGIADMVPERRVNLGVVALSDVILSVRIRFAPIAHPNPRKKNSPYTTETASVPHLHLFPPKKHREPSKSPKQE